MNTERKTDRKDITLKARVFLARKSGIPCTASPVMTDVNAANELVEEKIPSFDVQKMNEVTIYSHLSFLFLPLSHHSMSSRGSGRNGEPRIISRVLPGDVLFTNAKNATTHHFCKKTGLEKWKQGKILQLLRTDNM